MNKQTVSLKDQYLASKAQQWSASTLRPVSCRLALIPDAMLPHDPQGLYDSLAGQGYGAYTIKQVMLLATQVCKHTAPSTETYSRFMADRRRLFANAYAPKKVPHSFDDTLKAIKTMANGSREFALGLIVSGLRISEAANVDADGQVVGKGNKLRSVPNADMVTRAPRASLQTFRRELKAATGLTPHQLRKLAASKFVEFGAREAELCSALGWSSFSTASLYIQANGVAAMSDKLKKMVNG